MTPEQAYPFILACLCIWREARGCTVQAKLGVAWSIQNRVNHPSWWGTDVVSVILKPYQYSSFDFADPNAIKFPQPTDTSWQACLQIMDQVTRNGEPDPTNGATHYYDKSLDDKPPAWARDGSMIETAVIDSLRFWKRA